MSNQTTNPKKERKLGLVSLMVLGKICQNGNIPSKLGLDCGIHYQSASSWGHHKLKGLEKRGLVVRRGPDDFYFTATEAGRAMWRSRKAELDLAGEWLPMCGTFRNIERTKAKCPSKAMGTR